MGSMNSTIPIKEFAFVVKNLPTKEAPGQMEFTIELYRIFKEKNNANSFIKLKASDSFPMHYMRPTLP